MDLKELNKKINPFKHWYYVSKSNAISKILNINEEIDIVDIGAGSGFFSKYLLKNTKIKSSLCLDIAYKKNYEEIIENKKIFYKKKYSLKNKQLVILIDVIEHVEKDKLFLKKIVKKIDKNTKVFISVPAFMFMWSDHDLFLNHKRRYNLHNLSKLVSESGLKIENSFYYFSLIFLPAFFFLLFKRLFLYKKKPNSNLNTLNPILNKFLILICKFELLFFKCNKYFGLSLFCVARKI